MRRDSFRAIAFDFGNTLCPWDDREYWQVTRGAMDAICRLSPTHDFNSAYQVFSRLRAEECAKNLPWLRENDIAWVLRRTAEELTGRAISDEELHAIVQAQVDAFLSACRAPRGLSELLRRLSAGNKLAVLSNYSISEAVHLALANMGISEYFDIVVVSGDVGYIKPSRELFEYLLARLGCAPGEVLFVGDDWLADIVGACAVGMPAIQVVGYTSKQFADRMEKVFGEYIRKALSARAYACWKDAKPIAVLESVFDLEWWLKGE